MIQKLKKEDIEEAARVYNKGLSMQIPEGYARLDETVKLLKRIECIVHKTNNRIDGLVSFEKKKDKIYMKFICALKFKEGIGKKLIKKLADHASKSQVKLIYSVVSTKDKRAMKFYEHCGFKKYGQYYQRKNFLLNRIKAKPKKIISSLKPI